MYYKDIEKVDSKYRQLDSELIRQYSTREGFAFSKDSIMGTASGGYNDDGTVAEDATVNGWRILIRGSRNIEVRNLGTMLFPDDGVSLDTDNENIWIHNNEIFYGIVGSDADQAKGDGSADVKGNSTNVTVLYNHLI